MAVTVAVEADDNHIQEEEEEGEVDLGTAWGNNCSSDILHNTVVVVVVVVVVVIAGETDLSSS